MKADSHKEIDFQKEITAKFYFVVCRSLFFQPATPLACKDNQSLNNSICLEALHVSRELLKLFLIIVGVVVYHNVMHVCRPEDNPVKSVLSFSPYVGPGRRTQVTRPSW